LAAVAKSSSDHAPVPVKVPLKLRLKAWWDGCDVIVHQREGQGEPAPPPAPRRVISYRDPERPWQTARAKLACMLWG